MKYSKISKIVTLGLLSLIIAGCGSQFMPMQVNKKVMTVEDSLKFFNLRDVGQIQPLAQGKVYLTKKDIQVQGAIDTKSLRVLSDTADISFIEVGDWYIPASIYGDLQPASTPYSLSIDALNLLEGSELHFIFTSTPDQMRSELEKYNLSVKDIRILSQDGEINVEDLKKLADKVESTSIRGKLLAMSGFSFRKMLENRIEIRQRSI